MRRRVGLITGLAVASLGWLPPAAAESTPAKTDAKGGQVVARVGSEVITADEVKDRLSEYSATMLERYRQPKAKREFVENMVKFKILSREAFKKGFDKSPLAQQQFERMLVQLLIKDFYDQKVDVPEEDLKAFYDSHVADFVKPAKIRVQQLFLEAAELSEPKAVAARRKAKATAVRLLAEIRTERDALQRSATPLPPNAPLPLLAQLAKEQSADATTKALGGDTRFQSLADLTKTYSPEFSRAVGALTEDSPLSGVIETPQGFHIAYLIGKVSELSLSFEDARGKGNLKERLLAETRSQRFEAYYQRLLQETGVVVDQAAMDALELPSPAQSTPAISVVPNMSRPPGE